jgi:hypothetical protein
MTTPKTLVNLERVVARDNGPNAEVGGAGDVRLAPAGSMVARVCKRDVRCHSRGPMPRQRDCRFGVLRSSGISETVPCGAPGARRQAPPEALELTLLGLELGRMGSTLPQDAQLQRHRVDLVDEPNDLVVASPHRRPRGRSDRLQPGAEPLSQEARQTPSASIIRRAAAAPEYCCWPVIRMPSRTACDLKREDTMKFVPWSFLASSSIRKG